jgi:Holliday junction resolvase
MSARKSMPLERDFQKAVLKKLRTIKGAWWVKINDRATAGIPDILGCVGGTFIALELKTKSRATKLQLFTLKKIRDAGGISYIITPKNFAEGVKEISQLAKIS